MGQFLSIVFLNKYLFGIHLPTMFFFLIPLLKKLNTNRIFIYKDFLKLKIHQFENIKDIKTAPLYLFIY